MDHTVCAGSCTVGATSVTAACLFLFEIYSGLSYIMLRRFALSLGHHWAVWSRHQQMKPTSILHLKLVLGLLPRQPAILCSGCSGSGAIPSRERLEIWRCGTLQAPIHILRGADTGHSIHHSCAETRIKTLRADSEPRPVLVGYITLPSGRFWSTNCS
jgi:hypothetical protein